ncbi:MAG: FAD-binding domain-containing protein [Myxococcota bacterium]|nr:FAD-binding domain-containing protein [Myxococcota bacterium]
MSDETRLALPEEGPDAAARFVDAHLASLCGDAAGPSPRFRGGQTAADAALARFDVKGYASRRNEVWPPGRRGASALSPYIRHGLLTLPRVWAHVAGGPSRDVRRFRDELLWQEYARHLYARLGERTREALRAESPPGEGGRFADDPWPRDMACMELTLEELERDGWLVNQTRMWLASQWGVRAGAVWQEGEEHFFRHLLDGSRAANRLGWQWTVGTGTGRPYGFSRWQVRKRAPGLCDGCALRERCPIEGWPDDEGGTALPAPAALARDPDLARTRGPLEPVELGAPEAVWLTAESLGHDDPALRAHPELPAVFVFDAPLLGRLRLSRKRLVFLVETLADLARQRELELHLGRPAQLLAGRPLAATFTPVPGWRRLAGVLELAVVHPWAWLVEPHPRSLASFSAWRKSAGGRAGSRGRRTRR